MKFIQIIRLSLLINIVLIVGLVWQTNKTRNFTSTGAPKQNTVNIKTVCDKAVQEWKRNDLETYKGQSVSVDFSTNPEAKLFQSTIVSQVSKGANFAGHYTVATWGCGTECEGFAVVNVENGAIIKYVPYYPLQAASGLSYSIDSNILVFNPRPNITSVSARKAIQDDYEARKGRVYFLLRENAGQDTNLTTLCVENLYSGVVD